MTEIYVECVEYCNIHFVCFMKKLIATDNLSVLPSFPVHGIGVGPDAKAQQERSMVEESFSARAKAYASVRSDFARRLARLMGERGWNQSEMSKRAQQQLPKGSDKKIGRDSISLYVNGKAMPGPIHLKAIADALRVDIVELVPSKGDGGSSGEPPKFMMRAIDGDDGHVMLHINQRVRTEVAVSIAGLLSAAMAA